MEGSVGDVGRHRVVKPVWGHAEHVRRLMYRYTRRKPCGAETGSRNYGNELFDPHFLFDPLYIMGPISTPYALL